MTDERSTRKDTPRITVARPYALVLAGIAIVAAIAPEDSLWHQAVMPAAIGGIAVSWLWRAARAREGSAMSFAAYSLLLAVGMLMRHTFDVPRLALVVVTVGMAACLLVGFGFVVRHRRREKELDRLIFSEASSLAFFVMMGLAVTYGFVESWLELAPPSAWLLAAGGALAYTAATLALRRKYL